MKMDHGREIKRIDNSIKESEIDTFSLLSTIWRNKIIVILSILFCVAVGIAYIKFMAVPMYRAQATVVMESRESEVVGLSSVLGGLSTDSSVVKTEVEVLRGRTLMGRVADELRLAEDPEFNSALRPQGFVARARSFIFGAPPAPAAVDPSQRRDSVVSALLNRVTITNVPQSLVFQIGVESEAAAKSARIADTVARLYIDDQVQVKFDATERAAQWLSGQVAELKGELEKSEEAIRRFQSDTSVIDATVLAVLDRQLKDTRERRASTEAQVASLEAQREAIAHAATPEIASAMFSDPQLNDLAANAADGDAGARAAFDARLRYLQRQLDQDTQRLRGQAASLAIAEGNLAANIEQQSQDLIQLDQMTRETEASRLLYEHFQTRMKEAVAQQGIQQADSRVLSNAVTPGAPASPRKPLIVAMMAVLGLILGCALVLIREMLASGVRTANDLEALTGRVVLGQVPVMPDRDRARLLGYLAQNPTSAAAEAVRNLRTSILLSDIDKAPRVIAVTSAVPGEGKTTLSLALAQNLTLMGKKVLIIEGDIRRRSFKRHLNLPRTQGLVTVLAGEARLENVVQPITGLGDVLIGEKAATNAADLFSSEAFSAMLAEAQEQYDIVIIDTPPVLVVPDARVIAPKVDATVFVVHWDRTSTTQVQEGLRMLDMPNTRLAGLVLSQIDPKGMRRYGYGERYGAYAAYGGKYYLTE